MGKPAKVLFTLNKQIAIGIGARLWCYFYIDLLCFTISLNKGAGRKWFGFKNNWMEKGDFLPF